VRLTSQQQAARVRGGWDRLLGELNFRVPDPLVFKGPCFRSISFGDDLAYRLTDPLLQNAQR
jgi:hypothetical protein